MADDAAVKELHEGPNFDRKSRIPIAGGLFYLGFLLIAAILILFVAGDLI